MQRCSLKHSVRHLPSALPAQLVHNPAEQVVKVSAEYADATQLPDVQPYSVLHCVCGDETKSSLLVAHLTLVAMSPSLVHLAQPFFPRSILDFTD